MAKAMLRLFRATTVGILLAALAAMAQGYAGKRVLHIDSYHEGHSWKTAISGTVAATLADTGAELIILRMDTKRNPSLEFKQQAALDGKSAIERLKSDVVIASDDNAFLNSPIKRKHVRRIANQALPFVVKEEDGN